MCFHVGSFETPFDRKPSMRLRTVVVITAMLLFIARSIKAMGLSYQSAYIELKQANPSFIEVSNEELNAK